MKLTLAKLKEETLMAILVDHYEVVHIQVNEVQVYGGSSRQEFWLRDAEGNSLGPSCTSTRSAAEYAVLQFLKEGWK